MDPDQTLTVISGGRALEGAIVSDGDTLRVVAADGENTTGYALLVTDDPLSSNAILTSGQYTIEVDDRSRGGTGTISGI
jgi:hypothetical protein